DAATDVVAARDATITDAGSGRDVGSVQDAGSLRDLGGAPDDRAAPDDTGVVADDGAAAVDAPVGPADVVAAVDAGADVPAPPGDTGVPRADAGPALAVTGVPRIDASLKAAMRAMYLRGMAAGRRAAVFAKLGDSITESASFLADFGPASGTPSFDLGAYTALEPTRAFFNATLVDASHSSFDRASLGAQAGWTAARALDDDAALVRQELAALRPAVAIVMFGSADIEATEVATFRANLTRVVQLVAAADVIPVLSTIPDRTDSPSTTAAGPAFNAAIREVAAAQRVPLEDYWAALQPLPNHGVSDDGVHPSIYRRPGGGTEAAYFTAAALAYGYNVRNLVTLATLAHVRAVIFDDGPPDP
ncbi:MAG: multifunctional acyl-CoA thioesterase and protease and lysophospholipase, partial [Myxococcaceae bacterium]|nr:multifunctional acyl-CoA thioesterase and protease and lysophospholipase [Myxococcaceae bacterium]